MSKLCCAAALLVTLLPDMPVIAGTAAETPFHFEVKEGRNLNDFLRDGRTAAHLVLRSGEALRILVAFPAGNSGVGLWFQPQKTSAEWVVEAPPKATIANDSTGRPLLWNHIRDLHRAGKPGA